MINFKDAYSENIFKIIFHDKALAKNYFAESFQCNLLENTITKATKISDYCDDFNKWFNKTRTFEIKHVIEEKSLEFAVIGIVKLTDDTQKDIASYIKLNDKGKIIALEFYANAHIDADLYGGKHAKAS